MKPEAPEPAMPSKFSKSRLVRKSSKSDILVSSAISLSKPPPKSPPTSSIGEKPLPPLPRSLTGVLDRLSRRRDLLALPSVVGSLNRGMERIRRHPLVAGGLGFKIPVPKRLTGTKTDRSFKPSTITPQLLASLEVEPEMVIAEDDEGDEDEDENEDEYKDEEVKIEVAVEMTIVPVRARLIYIGCNGLDSWGRVEGI